MEEESGEEALVLRMSQGTAGGSGSGAFASEGISIVAVVVVVGVDRRNSEAMLHFVNCFFLFIIYSFCGGGG